MAKYIQYAGLALVLIGAIILITGSFMGWQNNNTLNLSSLSVIIIGIITYIVAGKVLYEEITADNTPENKENDPEKTQLVG